MKYLLIYNIDELSEKFIIKSYIESGFEIMLETNKYTLIKKSNSNIKDESTYIKILNSYLRRSNIINESKGKIIDLTKAFKYASTKNGYDKFNNKFEWYIRNIIIKELITNK